MFNENIQDTEYTEDNVNKGIRGSALYYSTSQVAQILNIPDSTVRYYTKVFDTILNIEVYNKQRKYTQIDIDKLKFIVGLKAENMSVKQILEYCQTENEFDSEKQIQVNDNSPLSIRILSKALMEQQQEEFKILKEELFLRMERQIFDLHNQNIEYQANIRESIVQEVATTIDESIEEHLKSEFIDTNNTISDLKESIKVQNEKLEEVSEYFRVATVSQNNIKEVLKKPFFDRIIDRYFK